MIIVLLLLAIVVFPFNVMANPHHSNGLQIHTLTEAAIAKELGWVPSNENHCGGFYLDQPFVNSKELEHTDLINVNANQMVFAQHGTSVGEGGVTISRFGQQIIANKAYIYRDPATGKLSTIDLIDNVTLREPNNLVIAKSGHFDLKTKGETLRDILYRTSVYNNRDVQKNQTYTGAELEQNRKIEQLTAWGRASEFKKVAPQIYDLQQVSYSTCPPTSNTWRVNASDINLNKITGRGTARNARIYVKGVPIFYTPILKFPLDARRQTGFLTPTIGHSSKTGVYVRTPFYWNLAPNYDTTITPAYLSKRGLQMSDLFRYIIPNSTGNFYVAALPNDQAFIAQKESYPLKYGNTTDPFVLADLQRLQNASDTRKSVFWKDDTRFNEHWFANVDYSYVSDDYYLTDLKNNFNEVTQNQLLQLGQVGYESEHWKMLTRLQGYETLHPVDESPVQNQYTRLPQFVIEGNYPNGPGKLNYSVLNDLTRFEYHDTPGTTTISPTGTREHFQPGVSLPFIKPYFYFTPRLQFALTKYELGQVTTPNTTSNPSRALPIFDIHSGLNFDRDTHIWGTAYRQTLEPEIYYVYVPYKNQNDIPIFDTTANTLTYDELFVYNRFSGLDRIGDANQISYGITTRLIDEQSGFEKLRAGVGQIFYFRARKVTLCSPTTSSSPLFPCINTLDNSPNNNNNISPLSGMLTYNLNPAWSLIGNSIYNTENNQFNNQSITLHYQPAPQKIINLGYGFVRNGDIQSDDIPNSNASNLSQTDLSFAWPFLTSHDWSTIGRWTQNWNHHHFQNLLFGLQYDSCCWAVRFITGRAFDNLSPNNTYQYNTEFFIQFALKGLGNYGNADPSQLLSSSISGYQSHFGQDY